MKITMLSYHGCIRVVKMALPLIKKGHEVNLITFRHPSQAKKFTSVVICNDLENMQEAIKKNVNHNIAHELYYHAVGNK